MKILFNSDLLFATSLINEKLPRQVLEFLHTCRDKGHEIVIPLTTLFEFNKKQKEFVDKEIAALNSARTKLTDYGINVEEFESSDLGGRGLGSGLGSNLQNSIDYSWSDAILKLEGRSDKESQLRERI
jgi:hypothetical protein